jgi:ABC-type transport system involved in multi-copper enzyme maturation permease subunit
MTVHRRSYRPFEGELRPPQRLFWVITRRELRLGLRKKWVKRLLVLSAVPLVAFVFGLYIELVVQQMLHTQMLGNTVFTSLYGAQVFFVVLMMAALGADIIAKDVTAKAHHLYFSRPLTAGQYLVGKLSAVAVILAVLIIVPGVLLALAQLLLAPRQDFANFGRLCAGIVAYGVVLSVTAAAVIGCLSAYGKRARTVGALWVGLYFFSSAAAGGLWEVTGYAEWSKLLSVHLLFVDTGRLFYADEDAGAAPLVTLLVVGLTAAAVLYRRLRYLERSEQ